MNNNLLHNTSWNLSSWYSSLDTLRVFKLFIQKYWSVEWVYLSEIYDKYTYHKKTFNLNDDGFFYHDIKNIYLNTWIKKKSQDKIRKKLEESNILLIKKDTSNKNKLMYSLNNIELNKLLYPDVPDSWKEEIIAENMSDEPYIGFPGILSVAFWVNNTLFLKDLTNKRQYFLKKGSLVDGYLYSPLKTVENELGLSRKQQDKCKRDLMEYGIIDSHNGKDREAINGIFQKDCRWIKIYYNNILTLENTLRNTYDQFYLSNIKNWIVSKVEDISKQLELLFDESINGLIPSFKEVIKLDIIQLYWEKTIDSKIGWNPQKDIPVIPKSTYLLSSKEHGWNPQKDIGDSQKEHSEILEGTNLLSSKGQSEILKGTINNIKNNIKNNNNKKENSFDIIKKQFEEFWKTYPSIKKQNKEISLSLYSNLLLTDKTWKLHKYVIYHLKKLDDFRKSNNDTSFLPAPNKWIENKSYLDEYKWIKTLEEFEKENYDMSSYLIKKETEIKVTHEDLEFIKNELEELYKDDLNNFSRLIEHILVDQKYLLKIFNTSKKDFTVRSIIKSTSVEIEKKYGYKKWIVLDILKNLG